MLFRSWRPRPEVAYGLAAALLIALIGVAAWNLSLRSGGDNILVRMAQAGDGQIRVIYVRDQNLVVIDYTLPQLPPDRIYQAWAIPRSGGAPVSLGLLARDGPSAFKADLRSATAVAVSVEPPGGSTQPTTTPVVIDPLS